MPDVPCVDKSQFACCRSVSHYLLTSALTVVTRAARPLAIRARSDSSPGNGLETAGEERIHGWRVPRMINGHLMAFVTTEFKVVR